MRKACQAVVDNKEDIEAQDINVFQPVHHNSRDCSLWRCWSGSLQPRAAFLTTELALAIWTYIKLVEKRLTQARAIIGLELGHSQELLAALRTVF